MVSYEQRVWEKMVNLLPTDRRQDAQAAWDRWQEFKRLVAEQKPIAQQLCVATGEIPPFPYTLDLKSYFWTCRPPVA